MFDYLATLKVVVVIKGDRWRRRQEEKLLDARLASNEKILPETASLAWLFP